MFLKKALVTLASLGIVGAVVLARSTPAAADEPAGSIEPVPNACGTTNTPCQWQDDCCPGYYCGGPSPVTCQRNGT